MKRMIHPLKIPKSDLPLIVLSTDMTGFIQWAIRAKTDSNYNHIMSCIHPHKFASQNLLFEEVSMIDYMNRHHRLKFWKIKDITDLEKLKFVTAVNRDLTEPIWLRLYDFLGIFGQLFGVRFLNISWRQYCSEKEGNHLRAIGFKVPKHPTPAELDEFMENNDRFEVYGYWDDEVEDTKVVQNPIKDVIMGKDDGNINGNVCVNI